MESGTKGSCTCHECVNDCMHRPGWFKPGQVELVAEHLGLMLEELFETKLVVDWWVNVGEPDTYVLSPGVYFRPTGTYMPANPRGICVFLKDGLCEIHPVKPFECRESLHSDSEIDSYESHRAAAMAWKPEGFQRQIEGLLERTARKNQERELGARAPMRCPCVVIMEDQDGRLDRR